MHAVALTLLLLQAPGDGWALAQAPAALATHVKDAPSWD